VIFLTLTNSVDRVFVRLFWVSGLRPDMIAFGVPIMAVLQKHILPAVGGIQGKKNPASYGRE